MSRKQPAPSGPPESKRPKNTPFLQQTMSAWQPIMTPKMVIAVFIAVGVAFIPIGVTLMNKANTIYEDTIVYDSGLSDSKCPVTMANKPCILRFTLTQDIDTDLHVYYQLTNFYQNHRIYVASKSNEQLRGLPTSTQAAATLSCGGYKTSTNSSRFLNPCGLIANSFFTDKIILTNTVSLVTKYTMVETGISWPTDKDKFVQPSGFQYKQLPSNVCSTTTASATSCQSYGLPSDCKFYGRDTATCFLFYYPNDGATQYLYETYPANISPIEGVTNEHFMVWMRTAALPTFRKLYGIIKAPLKSGDVLEFSINPTYEVASFKGSKALIISTVGNFGGKNIYLGAGYVVVGGLSLLLSLMFVLKYAHSHRGIGDPKLLTWSN